MDDDKDDRETNVDNHCYNGSGSNPIEATTLNRAATIIASSVTRLNSSAGSPNDSNALSSEAEVKQYMDARPQTLRSICWDSILTSAHGFSAPMRCDRSG